ncbi:DsbE family thiol:disulfide interchange protein [Dongia sp.]|uniref:DsbE family thiol:disulfide interchange protein n=1 Tax=Dongia sp. TaxID=1977262 RepID=UPI0035B24DB2
MRRLFFILPLLLVAVLVAVFWRGLDPSRDPGSLSSALIGKPVPDFALPGLGPDQPGLTSADFKGEVTVLNFFASWCAPCRAEHPLLVELAKNPKIRVVGITYKDRPADSQRFLAELGNPFVWIGADESGRTGIDFGLTGVPETYIIDRAGILRYRLPQPIDPTRLAEEILPLITELTQ